MGSVTTLRPPAGDGSSAGGFNPDDSKGDAMTTDLLEPETDDTECWPCDHCGRARPGLTAVGDFGEVCGDCLPSYSRCPRCNEWGPAADLKPTAGGPVCESCLDADFRGCVACGAMDLEDTMFAVATPGGQEGRVCSGCAGRLFQHGEYWL